jgi:hypothetical protein
MSVTDVQISTEPASRHKFPRQAKSLERQAKLRAAKVAAEVAALANPRRCKTCGQWMEQERFSSYVIAGKRYWHTRCIRCRSSVYLKSKTCREKRALLANLKAKPCAECGGLFAAHQMRFICVDGYPRFNLEAAWAGRKAEEITNEAKRCVVVCLNCKATKDLAKYELRKPLHSRIAELPADLRKELEVRIDVAPASPSSAQ